MVLSLATSISWICGALYLFIYFYQKKSSLRLSLRTFRFELIHFKEIIGIGAASFLRQISASILIIVMNNLLPFYGGVGSLAVLGILNRINMFIFLPMFGVLQGVNPVIGYNYGAGNIDRVKQAFYFSVFLNTMIGLLYSVVIFMFSENIFALFSDTRSLIIHGSDAMIYSHAALVLAGFQIIASGMFQALGRIRISIIVSLLRQFIFLIPLFFVMGKYYKLDGIWLSFPVSDIISTIIIMFLIIQEFIILNCIKSGNNENVCIYKVRN